MEEPLEQMKSRLMLEQSMRDTLANLDRVTQEALAEKEKAIDEQIAARDLLSQIEKDAHSIAEVLVERHRNGFVTDLRKEIWGEVIRKLILSGLPSLKLKEILGLSSEVLAEVWNEIGFDAMDDQHVGYVGYHSEGKAGKVILYREDVVVRFDYEFGAGQAIAYIMVPPADRWVAQTGIPLDERMSVLEFLARRVCHDQTPGHGYRITHDAIYFEAV